MLAAFLTTMLFSLSAVCGVRTARLVGGTEANFWRLVFAAILLAIYAHGWGLGLDGASLPIFLLSGCLGFGFGDAAYFQALPRIGSRLSVMLVLCLSAPIAALIEWFWLGTRLSRSEILCALIILAGVALALSPSEQEHLPRRRLLAGISYGLLAALGQAGGAVLSRKGFALATAAAENVDGITAAYQRILGGILVMAFVLLAVQRSYGAGGFAGDGRLASSSCRKSNWGKAWPWILLNGLAGPALGVSCFQWALKTTPAGVVLPIVATTPIVILPFSRLLEGERPSTRSLAGGLLAVLGAVWLASNWANNG